MIFQFSTCPSVLRTHEQEPLSKSVEETKSQCEAADYKLQHIVDEIQLKQSELLSRASDTASVDQVDRLEHLLTSIRVAESERDELQQQCDFIDNEIAVKEEELEELRDRLEEDVYDAQKKEVVIAQMDKTLLEKQQLIADRDYEVSQRQSELADLRYVCELEESNFSQLLSEKDRLCRPINEVVAGLRQELQSVEMDIGSQEKRMERLKGLKSEMAKLEAVLDHRGSEYEDVSKRLDAVSSELVTRRSELDSVMMEIQQRHEEVNMLSKDSAHIASEHANVVSCLDEILMTWTGQKPAAVSPTGMVGLSAACVARLAELKRIAEWKHGEISELNQVVGSRLSQLSAVDGSLREKQRKLDELHSAVEMQQSAFQQMEAEFRQQRVREEKQIAERKQDLGSLHANSVATEKKVEEIER